jgi:3-oxoacyl-[acyl-carrier-protein] synthase-1
LNVITGIGLVSALGLDSSTSLAAARAGLSRSKTLRTINAAREDFLGGSPVAGHSVACGLADGFVGRPKALIMGRAALADLAASATVGTLGRVGLYVVLSDYFLMDETRGDDSLAIEPRPAESFGTIWRRTTSGFVEELTASGPLSSAAKRRVYYGGHAKIARAVLDAQADLASRAVDACVIGAIDSCVEPRVLRAAALAALLKTEAEATGFSPGEGAAFFLLQRESDSADRPLRVAIDAVATAKDENHSLAERPPMGVGLASAVEQCLGSVGADAHAEIGVVVSDLNGAERRAVEWGYCLVRLQPRHPLGHARVWLPAMSFGETGCAAGPIAVCTAVRGLNRGYAGTERIAVVLSSDSGDKAALCLRAQ